MKNKSVKILLLFSFLVVMLAGCGKNIKDPKVLVLGTDPTYFPYERIGLDGDCEGFDIDLAKAIALKLNKKLVIKQFGFTALILSLKQEKVDFVLAGMSITPSRQKEIEMIPYQGNQITSFYLLFWGEKPSHVQNIQDVNQVSVMVGTCEEDYLRSLPHITYRSLESTTEIMMDLQYGKTEAALIEPKVANVLKKQFPSLVLLEVPLEEKDWTFGKGLGLKKGSSMVKEFENALSELQADGTLQKLEAKWMVE